MIYVIAAEGLVSVFFHVCFCFPSNVVRVVHHIIFLFFYVSINSNRPCLIHIDTSMVQINVFGCFNEVVYTSNLLCVLLQINFVEEFLNEDFHDASLFLSVYSKDCCLAYCDSFRNIAVPMEQPGDYKCAWHGS